MPREPEPLRPPAEIDTNAVTQTRFYCLECGADRYSEGDIRTHVRTAHGEETPMNGVEYARGSHVLLMWLRWNQWSQREMERFSIILESLRGGDDFLVEVGDGLPDA